MKPSHKLFVTKVLDRKIVIDQNGQKHTILKTIKEEVPEISLGSVNNPNKDIIEFDFVPIDYDDKSKKQDDAKPTAYDLFRRFFGEQ